MSRSAPARQPLAPPAVGRIRQPESRVATLVNETLYKGQPYENRPQGTLASVAALTPAQLQAQPTTYMHSLQTVTLGRAQGLDEKQGTAL